MKLSLEALRVNAEMTQQDLADKMHVARRTISSWEQGNTPIGAGYLLLFVNVINDIVDDENQITVDNIRLPKLKPKHEKQKQEA